MWDGNKPILKIELLEGANLEILDPEIDPIIEFSSAEESVQSKIGVKSDGRVEWKEKLSISLDPRYPLYVSIKTTKDEETITLNKVTYEFAEVSLFKRNQNIWTIFATSRKQLKC